MDNNFTLNIHEIFMSRALELAKQGRGRVSPNPMVGCVLVKDGEVIGEGYHEEFGGPHAEIMAFRNSRKDPMDSVAYVNLEPCCIRGKTPPCTNALIENGISEELVPSIHARNIVSYDGLTKRRNRGGKYAEQERNRPKKSDYKLHVFKKTI